MSEYVCYVCRQPIELDPHTYHAEGCPTRFELPCFGGACSEESGCGEDCHAECCPICTGQAF